MNTTKVGLIGFGTLGQTIADHVANLAPKIEIIGALEIREPEKHPGFLLTSNIDEILCLKPDVIIECAGQQVLKQFGVVIAEHGIDLVPASVGSLADDTFRETLISAAVHSKAAIRIPSGAIAGIDGLSAARHSGIDKVLYRGITAPQKLKRADGSYYQVDNRTVVFKGTAREAVVYFPKNANLTATISLAGVGFDHTYVEIVVDPEATRTTHELYVRGWFGEYSVIMQGDIISDASPTSRIVAGSLVQAAMKSNYTFLT